MSRATEDANRRLLRARDAMDRAYAEPLDITALARIANVSDDDVDFGVMRWLTVRVPGEDRLVLLERPDPPRYDPATTDAIREMVTKGASGGHLFFYTDDAYTTHAALKAKGVEIPDEPTKQDYGIDFGFRDPFGNHLRITQRYADAP
jgi:hypothetical protein